MNESNHPKVEIRFPVHVNGFDELAELPFVIGVMGDFAGKPLEPPFPLRSRKFITIDPENFDDVLAAFSPRLCYSVENKLQNDGSEFEVELNFKCLADFEAVNIARRVEPLRQLLETGGELHSDINDLNAAVSAQLSAIVQHPLFKNLESAWRGLFYLVENTENSHRLKIKVIHATWVELLKNFERTVEISATAMFRWIYDAEFNAFGGEPFGALIGNYEISYHPQDIALLTNISKVAALAQTPFISGAAPAMFGYESFLEVFESPAPGKLLSRMEYKRWNEFRETKEAEYVSLCLPHFLLRKNDDAENLPSENFSQVSDRVSRHLWGNAAFAFGVVLARAFARNKWLAQIDGDEFGTLENVPQVRLWNDLSPIDAEVYEHHSRNVSNESLNVITKYRNNKYFFLSANSCKKFKPSSGLHEPIQPVDIDLHISSLLSVIFPRARFMHHLMKIIKHESIRQKHTAAELEEILNNWISQYCADSREACSATRPLAAARIEVKQTIVDEGSFLTAKFYIKPGYRLPEINLISEIVFNDF